MMLSRFLSFFLLFFFSSTAFAVQPEIIIGASLSLSGKYAPMGAMQKKGFSLWQDHVNAKNGILGKKVRMIISDDKSDPAHARDLYEKMIKQDGVDLIFGPYSSTISEAILPIAEKYRYPVLLSGASADRLWEKGYRYAFGVYTPASKYTVGFLEMLVTHDIKDIAIVSADDAFSSSLSSHTKKWAQKFRLNVVLVERFKKGQRDLSDIALRAEKSGAQAVVVCGHLDESIDMKRAFNKNNWHPFAYYASVGPATKRFHQILKEDANLTFSSSQWEKEVGVHLPMGKRFIASFKKTYKTDPTYHAATAYAAGMILEAALIKNKNLDRDLLRNTLSAMDTMTVIGRYGVDKTGWQIRHFPLIIQWQGGKKTVVWPEKLKKADPIFDKR